MPEPLDQLARFTSLIMLMIAGDGSANAIVVEEYLATAGIFGGDQIDLLQHANRPKSDIFEVAIGCGNNIKSAGH